MTTLDHNPKTHTLRPSDAPAWTICAAKPAFTQDMPDEAGEAAALGTCKHEVTAACIAMGFITAEGWLGDTMEADGFSFTVDDDFVEHVNKAVAKAEELCEGADEIWTEISLPMHEVYGTAGQSGTADLQAYWAAEKRLLSADHKFGRKVRYARDRQNESYAVGGGFVAAAEGREVDTYTLAVIQPVINHYDVVTYSNDEMAEAVTHLRDRADATFADHPEFTPDDVACQWCAGKDSCPGLREHVVGAVPEEVFVDLDAPLAAEGDDSADSLGADVAAIPLIEAWCDSRMAKAKATLQEGGTVTGQKLVDGKPGNRTFTDADAVHDLVYRKFRIPHARSCNMTLKSPTQLLKVNGIKGKPRRIAQIEEFITRKDGKPVMVAESDPRPATAPDTFTDLDSPESLA